MSESEESRLHRIKDHPATLVAVAMAAFASVHFVVGEYLNPRIMSPHALRDSFTPEQMDTVRAAVRDCLTKRGEDGMPRDQAGYGCWQMQISHKTGKGK